MADKKNKNKNKAVERRTTPGRGRYGGFRLSRPPHAPRSPSTYTAMDLYSRTYHTAAHGLVKNFVPVSFRDIQQHKIRWYPRYCAGIFHFFYDCPPSRGASDPSPGEALDAPRSPSRSSAPVLSPGPPRAAVGRAWSHREAAGGQVELGSRSYFLGIVCYTPHILKDPYGHRQ